ncbi:twin-arginine translocase subunit TatC [Cryomorphaceae bacterium]|nr:twin-arginine translocase subunit TatC [Cryomorphaceae bacterium]
MSEQPPKQITDGEGAEMGFLDHLEILRWHLIRSAGAVILFAIVAFVAKSIVFDVIIFGPKNADFVTYRMFCLLSQALGLDDALCMTELPFTLQNIDMAGQFTTHIWVSLIAGFIVAFPYVLWEVWRFIKPGLKKSESRYASGVVFFSSLLFMAGVSFGYFMIAPLSVNFLGSYTVSQQVANEINLGSFISTVTTVTLATGLIFELPILVYFFTKLGLLTPQMMKTYRRHAIVVTVVLSAIITPPDIASQILVSLPLLVLYEISIFISARVIRNQKKAEAHG